jgi:O-antigen/teichoic acid export membrane protein
MGLTKKVAYNTVYQLAGKAASTFLGLLAVMILTRHLGVEKFGWYVTAVSFMQFIIILSDFGFTVTTAGLLADPKMDKKKLLNTLFTLRFVTGFVFNLVAALLIWLFPYPTEIKLAAVIMSLSFFFISLNQVFWGYYQEKLKMAVPAVAEFLSRIVLVIGLYLMMRGNYGFLPMMIMITGAAGVLTLYLWIKSEGVKFFIERSYLPKIFVHMWPLAISIIFNAIYLQGDKVILPLFVSQIEVGLYGASFRVLEILIQITALIVGTLLPLLAFAYNIKDKKLFEKRTQMTFDLMSFLILPMIFGIFVLATPIIKMIAGDEFAQSGLILQAISPAIAAMLFGMTFGHIVLAMSKQKKTLWIYISDAIISIILYFIFIPLYGLWGAVGVVIFSELYAGILLTIMAIRLSKFVPSFVNFIKIVFACTIMALGSYYLPSPHVLVSILYGIIIYSLLVLILKIIPKQIIKDITSSKKVA